ncbi:MAG TPA: GEVED domain-containing protein [Bacteroidales bacterium]|nr:GEVED domain-containing protein [Bacteroidales bacterium]
MKKLNLPKRMSTQHRFATGTTALLLLFSSGLRAQTYCVPQIDPDLEFINAVSIGSINNVTGNSSYTDYTYLTTAVVPGNTYQISILDGRPFYVPFGSAGDHHSIWVDWNHDGEFSSSEGLLNIPSYTPGPYISSITVPQNAHTGITRMRIIMHGLTPCSGGREAEDYGLEIQALYAMDAGIAGITAPLSPNLPGLLPLSAILFNNGADTLHSVSLFYSIDGVPATPVVWSGNLASAARDTLLLDSIPFSPGQHIIQVWVQNPNGVADMFVPNDLLMDTVIIADTASNPPGSANMLMDSAYVIGGPTADFQTITEAITAAVNGGIGQSVCFYVYPGTYAEQLTIAPIPGASAQNRVCFRSLTGDPADVIIRNTAYSGATNWTLMLNGADYVCFRDLTIMADHTSYARVVDIRNGADGICIEGCVLISNPQARSNSNSACIYDNAGNDNFLTIRNNEMVNGYYGVFSLGKTVYDYTDSTQTQRHLRLVNNAIADYYTYGVRTEWHSAMHIDANDIRNHTSSPICMGMYFRYLSGIPRITNNTVVSVSDGQPGGLDLGYCSGSSGAMGLLANNLFYCTGSSSGYIGLVNKFDHIDYLRIIHNTFYLTNGGTYTVAVQYANSSNCQHINNILGIGRNVVSSAKLLDIRGFPFSISDYNNYFWPPSCTLGFLTLSNYSSTSGFLIEYGSDANSVSLDPWIGSPDVPAPRNFDLYDKGTPVPDIPFDIRGTARSATGPDMGCYEVILPPDDVSMYAVEGPESPMETGTYPVIVSIRNTGAHLLSSCSLFVYLDETLTHQAQWNGSLMSGLVSAPIALGNVSVDLGEHLLRVYCSHPNNEMDVVLIRDTLELALTVCEYLSGTYTIGDTAKGSDFGSFTEAILAMSGCRISDSVTFLVDSGDYFEQVQVPVILGAGPSSGITFRSASGNPSDVNLHYTPSLYPYTYVFSVSGGNYITLKDITISVDPGSSQSNAIEFLNAASHNQLIHCRLNIGSGAYGVYSDGTATEYNRISRCSISGGYRGIHLDGAGLGARGNIIEYCTISGSAADALRLSRQFAPLVKNNMCTSTLSLEQCTGGSRIEGNDIRITAYSTFNGMSLYSCLGLPNQPITIVNNIITISNTRSNTICVYLRQVSEMVLANNTINNRSTGSSLTGLYGLLFGTNTQILNNCIRVKDGLAVLVYDAPSLASIQNMDNNILYVEKGKVVKSGAQSFNLPEWMASSGHDVHSLSLDPEFLSLALPVPTNMACNDIGFPLALAPSDIFGAIRGVPPDAGAIEFGRRPLELKLIEEMRDTSGCGLGMYALDVSIVNQGLDTVSDSLSVTCELAGSTLMLDEQVTAAIPPGDTLRYSFTGQLDLHVDRDSLFKFRFWIAHPSDPVHGNDTSEWTRILSLPRPLSPTVSNACVEQGSPVTLRVLNADSMGPFDELLWYDQPQSQSSIGRGDSLYQPSVVQTTPYYVESISSDLAGRLKTLMSPTHYTNGYMYDLQTNAPVLIDSFWFNFLNLGVPLTIQVYYRQGSYVGVENDPTAWTLLGSVATTTRGYNKNSLIPVGGLLIMPGQTYGIYITSTSPYSLYTRYTGSRPSYADGAMTLTAGVALLHPFGSLVGPAIWNGTVHYSSGNGCPSHRVADTIFVRIPVDAGRDTSLCLNEPAFALCGGLPAGGMYSGPGVSSHSFNPSLAGPGLHTIHYTYTDTFGVQSTDSLRILVRELPLVKCPGEIYIPGNLAPIDPGALPSGGTYSGLGIVQNLFDPAALGQGSYPVTYSYTDSHQCSNTCSFEVIIRPYELRVEGQVVYANSASSPLPGFGVVLTDLPSMNSDTVYAGLSGQFSFTDLLPGTYSLYGFGRAPWPWGSINATDAMLIALHFAQLAPLPPFRALAGDVNLSGSANVTDALQVAQRFSGILTHFAAPDWVLSRDTLEIPPQDTSLIVSLAALAAGDVNASHVPATKNSPEGVLCSTGWLAVDQGSTIDLPFSLMQEAQLSAFSVQLMLPSGLEVISLEMDPDQGGLYTYQVEDRTLTMAWYTLEPLQLAAGTVLFHLRCKVTRISCSQHFELGDVLEFADIKGQSLSGLMMGVPLIVPSDDPVLHLEAYPNPLGETTSIAYRLPVEGQVSLELRDMAGRRVCLLESGVRPAGAYQLSLDARPLARGTYVCILSLASGTQRLTETLKLVVIR